MRKEDEEQPEKSWARWSKAEMRGEGGGREGGGVGAWILAH